METKLVSVSFDKGGKGYSFDPCAFDLKENDIVVVDTIRGEELGYICSPIEIVEDYKYIEQLKKVLRFATPKDIEKKNKCLEREKTIKVRTEEIVAEKKLDMKIVSASLSLDQTKIIINFTADDRVDFRELVKELASTFKARIELKQIGQRDETKLIGGLGPCGRPCCCNQFLNDFEHSTIKMAKNQGLSLNPTKISGLCGRLMCCLSYENENYVEALKEMPKVNSFVETANGKGQVVYNNLFKKTVQVKHEQGENTYEIKEYSLNDIKWDGKNSNE